MKRNLYLIRVKKGYNLHSKDEAIAVISKTDNEISTKVKVKSSKMKHF